MTRRGSKELFNQIYHFAQFPQTSVSLQQMVQFGSNPSQGTLLRASQFLADELPVRLAHRVKELDHLPDKLSDMPSVQKVKNWYAQSFEELVEMQKQKDNFSSDVQTLLERSNNGMNASRKNNHHNNNHNNNHHTPTYPKSNPSIDGSFRTGYNKSKQIPMEARFYGRRDDFDWPPEVRYYNERFCKVLNIIKRRHDPVVTTIAQGILEYKKQTTEASYRHADPNFLDRFYMSRIGIRMLIGQHIALTTEPSRENYVGIICTKTNVQALAQEAIDNARFICEDYYGLYDAPKVQLSCPPDLEFMYVPGHFNHICFEILKNALRAVVEHHGVQSDHFPPIKMLVADGEEDITIKIADEGGGIARSAIPRVWTYMYTTAESQDLDPDFNKSDFKAPMAGFGYGLGLSRCYSRYFGGELKLISMEGYGTDCYLHLNKLSTYDEPLA